MHVGMYSLYCHLFTKGGAEAHVRELSRSMVRFGAKVSVVFNTDHATEEMHLIEEGVSLHVYPTGNMKKQGRSKTFLSEALRKTRPIFSTQEMAKRLLDLNCDLYHQHDLISNYLTSRTIKRHKRPLVLTNHLGEYLLLRKHLPAFLTQAAFKIYDHVIGPSEELTPRDIHPHCSNLWNGYNDQIFYNDPESRQKIRAKFGVADNDCLVLLARRWAPTKGVLFAAQAARLLAHDKKVHWVFLGQNTAGYIDYNKSVRKELENLPNVTCADSLPPDELAMYYNAADICLIPSILEAVSVAAVEAMACGTLIAASRVGGMPELIQHEQNGILFEQQNPQAIAQAVEAIAHNISFRKKLAFQGMKNVQKDLTWDVVAQRTMEVYQAVWGQTQR